MSFFKIILFLCFILLTPCSPLYPQAPNPLRIEIEVTEGSDNFNIVPLSNKGLIMFYENIPQNPKLKIRNQKSKVWVFTKYDTLLTKLWYKEIIIPGNLEYLNYYYDSNLEKLYILLIRSGSFSLSDNINSNEGDINIISVDMLDGENKLSRSSIPKRMSVREFKVINNTAYISGNTRPSLGAVYFHGFMSFTLIPAITGLSLYKYKPVLISINLNSGQSKSISEHYKGNAYLLSEKVINDNKSSSNFQPPDSSFQLPYLVTIIKDITSRKETNLLFNNYNSDGKLLKSDRLAISPDTSIVSANYVKIANDNFFTGTYKKLHRRRIKFSPFASAAAELSLPAEGLAFGKITNDKPEFIKYYSFSNLQIFKSKDSQAKNVKYNKRHVNTNYQILLHDIIKKGNEYILAAEAYYPEYHLEYYWYTDSYGRTYQSSREVFDGFRYTHAIIVAFNSEGSLLWDNIFEIGNIISYNLKQRVKVMFDRDDIVLAYSNEGKITSKIINKNQVIQSKEETQIDRIPVNDKMKINYSSDMDYWYNNYFITYGYKNVIDKSERKSNRSAFFFNKIAFQ